MCGVSLVLHPPGEVSGFGISLDIPSREKENAPADFSGEASHVLRETLVFLALNPFIRASLDDLKKRDRCPLLKYKGLTATLA
jgi:hypothetical protein